MTNKNILGFGKDKNSIAHYLGITGAEDNKLKVLSIDNIVMLKKILQELKKFNIQLETVTQTKLTDSDAKSYYKII